MLDQGRIQDAWASGLDDVVAAGTRLSHVDGEAGQLTLAGRPVEAWAGSRFSALVLTLWRLAGAQGLPVSPQALERQMGKARVEAHKVLPALRARAACLSPIEALMAGLALMGDEGDDTPLVRAVGAAPVFVAGAVRMAQGLDPLAPDPSAEPVADYLRLLRGETAAPGDVDALTVYLITVADHGLNASTFAARVAASTRAGALSASVAAVATLKGPLHGGAPGPVLDMLDAIGTVERTHEWVEDALARGDRLMGFGHRIYRVRDPRADVLKAQVERLAGDNPRLAFAGEVERHIVRLLRELKPDRPLDTNVEFYTAVLLEALRIPRAAFAATFAVGRIAGWTAHIVEQERVGRLIRPQSVMVTGDPAYV